MTNNSNMIFYGGWVTEATHVARAPTRATFCSAIHTTSLGLQGAPPEVPVLVSAPPKSSAPRQDQKYINLHQYND